MRLKWEGMLEKNEVPKCLMTANRLPLCKCLTCKGFAEVRSIILFTKPLVSTLQIQLKHRGSQSLIHGHADSPWLVNSHNLAPESTLQYQTGICFMNAYIFLGRERRLKTLGL